MSVSPESASIFLIGAGRMGGALLRGWLGAGVDPSKLAVKDPQPSPEMAALLKERGIPELPRAKPDVVVVAVKPQIMETVLAQTNELAGPNSVILSIAAG